jgi:hypothetical protein
MEIRYWLIWVDMDPSYGVIISGKPMVPKLKDQAIYLYCVSVVYPGIFFGAGGFNKVS